MHNRTKKTFYTKNNWQVEKKIDIGGTRTQGIRSKTHYSTPAATEAEQWSSFNCINEKEFLNKPLDGAGCTQEVPGLCMLGNKILHGW